MPTTPSVSPTKPLLDSPPPSIAQIALDDTLLGDYSFMHHDRAKIISDYHPELPAISAPIMLEVQLDIYQILF